MMWKHYSETFVFWCDKVRHVWTDFQKWWKHVTGNEIDLNYKSIVFGVHPQNPDVSLNLSIIIIKRMIYIKFISKIQVPNMIYMGHFIRLGLSENGYKCETLVNWVDIFLSIAYFMQLGSASFEGGEISFKMSPNSWTSDYVLYQNQMQKWRCQECFWSKKRCEILCI